ncbi:MAG: BTAD domain-containing putative transcriptional regulator [Anaerolineae bacterium]|nr:tetratricopeptide repeat protein [Candidatus Roseilinea sp.]MDW8451613.1 BTAD domain-containing putative transcriptional regulator [Anaerolineae bacterium]
MGIDANLGVRLELLGAPQAQRGATPVKLSRKAWALLAYLAVQRAMQHRRALCDLLFSSSNDPREALRWHISYIRRHLGPHILLNQGDAIQLGQRCDVDCAQFEHILSRPVEEIATPNLQDAAALVRGEFAEHLALDDAPEFDLWLLGQRARYRSLRVRVLDELIQRATASRNWQQALRYATALTHHEPLMERGHMHQMRILAAMGQREAALDQFDRARALLRRELGVSPSAELIQLRDALAHQRSAALASIEPAVDPINSLANYRHRRAEQLFAAAAYTEALIELERAYALYAAHSATAGEANCLRLMAQVHLTRGQPALALPRLQQARELYRENHDQSSEAWCLSALAQVHLQSGDMAATFAQLNQAIAIAKQACNDVVLARAQFIHAVAWQAVRNVVNLRAAATDGLAAAQRAHDPVLAGRCSYMLAGALWMERRWDELEANVRNGLAEAQSRNDAWLVAWYVQNMGRLALVKNQPAEAVKWFDQAFAMRQDSGEFASTTLDLAWRARAHLANGQVASALEDATEATSRLDALAVFPYPWEAQHVSMAHAEALAAAGQAAPARKALKRAHDALMQFVAPLPADLRACCLGYFLNRHITRAFERGVIEPLRLT